MPKARMPRFGSGVVLILAAAHGACGDGEAGPVDPNPADAGVDGAVSQEDAGPPDVIESDGDVVDARPDAGPVCGDGILQIGEECDDGPIVPGHGCDGACRLEPGYKCSVAGQACTPTLCGDGVPEGTEQCDDGNSDWGDACSPLCTRIPICTDGTCQPACGDAVLLPGDTNEECDDGNNRGGDGCSPACKFETGFVCQLIGETPLATVDLPIVHRDFRGHDLPAVAPLPRGHIDFENTANGAETGIVAALLDPVSKKPSYAKEGVSSITTHGKAVFDQWFRDVPDVNIPVVGKLSLIRNATSGLYAFDAPAYFPLDAAGFVATGQEPKRNDGHNFSFTSETHAWFEYKGTGTIEVAGDDDIWVFINGRRAIDLGGIHSPAAATVTLSQQAATLGLQVGKVYEIAIFRAERRITGSSFRLKLGPPPRRTVCTPDA